MTIGRRRCTMLLALLLAMFAGVAAPGFFFGSDTASAVVLFEPDAPAVVLPPLLDLYDGQLVPKYYGYGQLPAYLAGILFAPLLVPMKFATGQIDYFYFVLAMRATQLLVGAIGLVYVYRLGLLCLPPALALAATFLVFTMPEYVRWTLEIHPDIYQTVAIMAGVFYLTRYRQSGRRSDYLLSAVCAGLAMAAKFYGLFLLPAAGWAAWACAGDNGRRGLARLWATFAQGMLYAGLMAAVFALFNLRIVCWDENWQSWFPGLRAIPERAGTPLELLSAKLANLASPNLLGPLFLLVYLAAALHWLWHTWRAGRQTPPEQATDLGAIHVTLATFTGYYLVLYSSAYNVYQGERYALPLFGLLPVAVVWQLHQLSVHSRFRRIGWLLTAALAVTAVLRICGRPLDVYDPLPSVIERPLYQDMLYMAGEADRQLLATAYVPAVDSLWVRRQPTLSAAQWQTLREYWRERCHVRSRPTTIAHRLTFAYRRERFARFQTRAWLRAHAAQDSLIYAEWRLNLLPTTTSHVNYSDNRDLPTQKLVIDEIDVSQLARLRPDYVLTAHERVAEQVLRPPSQYELAERLEGKGVVYVLRRKR